MIPSTDLHFRVSDRADLVLLTQRMNRLPELQPVSPIDRAILTTLVSELASNIVKYAGRGTISMACQDRAGAVDVRIVAYDEGPGIPDVDAAMAEGFSTGRTLGLGLPAVRRMADEFSIESLPGSGTCVTVRKLAAKALAGARADVGHACRPMPGERRCGDRAVVLRDEHVLWAAIIDGLGHGASAADAADRAAAALAGRFPDDLQVMRDVHAAVQGSAGVVMGLLQVRLDDGSFVYRGVGNTAAVRCIGESWTGVSRDGVLGSRLPSDRPQAGRLRAGDMLLLSTDGISDRLARPLLVERRDMSATELANEVLAQLAKPHDDAGCVVLKWGGT